MPISMNPAPPDRGHRVPGISTESVEPGSPSSSTKALQELLNDPAVAETLRVGHRLSVELARYTSPLNEAQRQFLLDQGLSALLGDDWPGPLYVGRVRVWNDGCFSFDPKGKEMLIWPARLQKDGFVIDLIAFDLDSGGWWPRRGDAMLAHFWLLVLDQACGRRGDR